MTTTDRTCTIVPYFQIQEGKLSEFKELSAKMVEQTKNEPGCYNYSFFFNDHTVFCQEGYEGAEGVLAHLENIGPLLEQALSIAELTFFEVHGPASELEKLQKPLTDLSPRYFELECGFRRRQS